MNHKEIIAEKNSGGTKVTSKSLIEVWKRGNMFPQVYSGGTSDAYRNLSNVEKIQIILKPK